MSHLTMPRFELERLTEYDDKTLLDEIRRVAVLIPQGKLKLTDFNRLSKVHSTTLRSHFGGWREALIAAGIGERFENVTEAWSRDEIVQHLQAAAKHLGRDTVTKRELQSIAGITDKPIQRVFGSYRAALEAAGLSQSALGMRYTDEECYENMLAVWTALGRQPYYSDMKITPSRVGPKAYVSRWGSWRGALKAFVERVNRDVPDAPQSEAPLQTPQTSTVPKRTFRDVPLGMKWKVHSRDRFRCVRCGRSPATHPSLWLEADHIFPWSRGGETVLENLRTLCNECNVGKGSSIDDI